MIQHCCYQYVRSILLTLGLVIMVAGVAIESLAVSHLPSLELQECQNMLLTETDRDVYVSGEMAFLRVVALNNSNDHDVSELFNVVMVNEKGFTQVEFLGELSSNLWYGTFLLEDTLPTGWYELIAFTYAMKSNVGHCMGRQKIFIVNRFDRIFPMITQEAEDAIADLYWAQTREASAEKGTKPAAGLMIMTDQEQYMRREQVKLFISAQNEDYRESLVSVSVVPQSALFGHESNANDNERLISLKGSSIPRETAGIFLSGSVAAVDALTEAGGVNILLSIEDSLENLLYTVSDKEGRFQFHLNDHYLGKEVFLQVYQNNPSWEGLRLTINNRFELGSNFALLPERPFANGTREYVLQAQEAVRISRAFGTEQQFRNSEKESNGFLHLLYTQPDELVIPADFQSLDNFQEISRELVHGMRVRTRQGVPQIRLMDERNDLTFFGQAPLVFVNGVAVQDNQDILDITSDQIREIRLLNRRWALGDLTFYGVLGISLEEETPFFYPNVTPVQLPDLNPQQQPVFEPDPVKVIHDQPDHRQVLLWKPVVDLDVESTKEIRFSTGDMEGDYIVRVVAWMADGSKKIFYHPFTVNAN